MENALNDLDTTLQKGERAEGIVFGAWGWGSLPKKGEKFEPGYQEPKPPPVPANKRGKLLTLKEAAPYMKDWSFFGGFGCPRCYAAYIWTNKRVLWVTEYDGSTSLDSAPRNPGRCGPVMPGGG